MSQKGRRPPVPPPLIVFSVTSGFGYNTRQPFVEVHVESVKTQMTPDSARQLALNLLQAADAAESDGFIYEFVAHAAELSEEQGAKLLLHFREYRDQQRKAQQAHDAPPAETA